MKRLIVFTVLITVASSSGCCRRGFGPWGMRGASCAPQMAPTYTPMPAYPPPAYGPPAYPPPAFTPQPCPPAPYDPCAPYGGSFGAAAPSMGTTVYSGNCCDGGMMMGGEGPASLPPMIESNPGTSLRIDGASVPGGRLSSSGLVGVPIYGTIIGDRKLEPGETLNNEYKLPLESAAARESKETK